MDTITAIMTRRSIRKFTHKPVPDKAIDTILRAAFVAPSAQDQRPWHFVVIRSKPVLEELSRRMEFCDMLAEATAGFLICGDERLEKIKGYWVQDCSACTQNVLLAAHAMGLGAVWIAVHPGLPNRMNGLRALLGIPEEVTPLALVALGHPAEQLLPEDRYDNNKVHYDNWGAKRN